MSYNLCCLASVSSSLVRFISFKTRSDKRRHHKAVLIFIIWNGWCFPGCSSFRALGEYIRSRWSPPGERWPLPPKQSPSTSGCENGFFLCEWLTLVIILVLLVIFLDDLELMIWTRLWFKLDNLPYLYLLRRDHDRSQTLCINTIFSGFSVWRGCDYHYKWFHIHRCNSWLHFYTM